MVASLCLFLVYLKGWSPQFVLYPIVFFLLALGPFEGPLFAIVLSIINYIEVPIWLLCRALAGSESAAPLLLVAVVARTALLLYVLALAERKLRSRA